MIVLSRALERGADGNRVARYADGREAYHFAHAEVYCHFAQDCIFPRLTLTTSRCRRVIPPDRRWRISCVGHRGDAHPLDGVPLTSTTHA